MRHLRHKLPTTTEIRKYTNLEQESLDRCQHLPAPYKRLIHDLKRNQQTDRGNNSKTTTDQSLQLSRFDDQSHHDKTDQSNLKTTLHLTLKMTTAQVVETSVINNSRLPSPGRARQTNNMYIEYISILKKSLTEICIRLRDIGITETTQSETRFARIRSAQHSFCLKVVTHPITNPTRPGLTSELVCLLSLFLAKILLSNATLPSLRFSALSVFPLPWLRELLRISYF